ncbi:MAG: SDR family oxidoreductase [Pseudomonadota bacterium]
MKRLVIIGAGFSGIECGRQAANACETVHGTTRSEDKFSKLTAAGIKPVLFDGLSQSKNDASLERVLAEATDLLVSIAPGEDGDVVLNRFAAILKQSKKLRWICYLSTVGVYGDHGGSWVNESSECRPKSKRSILRVAAEQGWQTFAEQVGVPLAIFRLSGIYGPGRNAFMNIEKGRSRRLVKPGQVFNRIHRDDIAGAFVRCLSSRPDGIFNITDDQPAPPQDVVTLAHELYGSTPPAEIDFQTADLSPMARSFYGENKRVSNAKSKAVLGMEYKWPNYQTALAKMWKEDCWRATD